MFSKTLIVAAIALVSFGANATLTVTEPATSGSFLTLARTGDHTGTLGGTVATVAGGAVLNADSTSADMQAFGAPFGGTFLSSGPSATSPSLMTFTLPASAVSFLWGSPDTYNTLTVTTNLSSYTYVPGGVGNLTFNSVTGSQSYAQYVAFSASAGESISSLRFASSVDAFEAANFAVTAVPEPETYALMIGGLGALGFIARRRKAV